MLTRSDVERWCRARWEEAHKADPYTTEEMTRRVLGREVFAWHLLSTRDLRRLSSEVFVVCMMARG